MAPPDRLRLKDGVDPVRALAVLRDLIGHAGSIRGAGVALEPVRDAYLDWADAVEVQFAGLSNDYEIVTMLQTARSWHIRELTSDSARPFALVHAEVDQQQAALRRLAEELERRIARAAAAPGAIT